MGFQTSVISLAGRWLVVMAVPVILLTACDESPVEQAQAYRESAREHYREGAFNAAVVELKNALQLNGEDADSRVLLGKVYLELRDGQSAEKELRKAQDLGVDDDALDLSLARALLLQGQFERVVELVPEDIEPDTSATRGQLQARGEALLGLSLLEAADAAFKGVLAAQPEPRAFAGRARVALSSGKADSALRIIEEGLERFPGNDQLLFLAGIWYEEQGRLAEAEARFAGALEKAPTNAAAHVGLVRVQIAQRKLEEASDSLEALSRLAPGSITGTVLKGVIAFESRDYAAAKTEMERVLAQNGNNLTAVYLAGASSYALGQYEWARSRLQQYVSAVPQNHVARILLASTLRRLNQPDAAARVLEPVGEPVGARSPGAGDYLSLVSTAALASGDMASGIRRLEEAVERNPDNAALMARLGAMQIAAGKATEGSQYLEGALEIDPDLEQADRMLLLSYLSEKRYDQVIAAAEHYNVRHPNSVFGYVIAGMAHVAQGSINEARASFKRALEVMPGAPDASANLAAIEARSGNVEEARAVLEQVLVHHPGHLRTLMQLSRLELNRQDVDAAKRWLRQAMDANPEIAQPRAELAGLHMLTNEPQTALDIGQAGLEAFPNDPTLLAVVGEAQLRTGQAAAAANTLERLTALEPKSIKTRLLLVEAYREVQAYDEAEAELEEVLAIDSGHVRTKVVLADLLLHRESQEDLARARGVIAELATVAPQSPEVLILQGQLALREGDPKAAVGYLSPAAQAVGSNQKLITTLARAQWEAGDREASTATLRQWADANPDDVVSRLLLSRNYESMGRLEEADAVLREVSSERPEHWLALNQLALLRLRQNDLEAALQYAERTLEESSQHPFALDTLGLVHLARNDNEAALTLLEKANAGIPGNAEIATHLARALVRNGKEEEARSLLRAALASEDEFESREDARSLLERLGG